MTAAEILLPGSSLEHLERRGTWLVATLRAEGAGRGQLLFQLLFFHGEAHGNVASLPLRVATGALETPEGSLGPRIPMPFPGPGTVELHLEGGQGERLTIVGQSLTVHPAEPEPPLVPLGRSRPSVP